MNGKKVLGFILFSLLVLVLTGCPSPSNDDGGDGGGTTAPTAFTGFSAINVAGGIRASWTSVDGTSPTITAYFGTGTGPADYAEASSYDWNTNGFSAMDIHSTSVSADADPGAYNIFVLAVNSAGGILQTGSATVDSTPPTVLTIRMNLGKDEDSGGIWTAWDNTDHPIDATHPFYVILMNGDDLDSATVTFVYTIDDYTALTDTDSDGRINAVISVELEPNGFNATDNIYLMVIHDNDNSGIDSGPNFGDLYGFREDYNSDTEDQEIRYFGQDFPSDTETDIIANTTNTYDIDIKEDDCDEYGYSIELNLTFSSTVSGVDASNPLHIMFQEGASDPMNNSGDPITWETLTTSPAAGSTVTLTADFNVPAGSDYFWVVMHDIGGNMSSDDGPGSGDRIWVEDADNNFNVADFSGIDAITISGDRTGTNSLDYTVDGTTPTVTIP